MLLDKAGDQRNWTRGALTLNKNQLSREMLQGFGAPLTSLSLAMFCALSLPAQPTYAQDGCRADYPYEGADNGADRDTDGDGYSDLVECGQMNPIVLENPSFEEPNVTFSNPADPYVGLAANGIPRWYVIPNQTEFGYGDTEIRGNQPVTCPGGNVQVDAVGGGDQYVELNTTQRSNLGRAIDVSSGAIVPHGVVKWCIHHRARRAEFDNEQGFCPDAPPIIQHIRVGVDRTDPNYSGQQNGNGMWTREGNYCIGADQHAWTYTCGYASITEPVAKVNVNFFSQVGFDEDSGPTRYIGNLIDAFEVSFCESIDTDNDGDPDFDDPDSDGDGLFDIDEMSRGTHRTDRDTDNDGVEDGPEVANGTNPLHPDSDSDGVNDGDDPQPLDPCIPTPGDLCGGDDGGVIIDAGQPDADAGSPNTDAGLPDADAGSPDTDAGQPADGGVVDCGVMPSAPDCRMEDNDQDGIPNYLEDRNGNGSWDEGVETDPNNPDTDGDGECDGPADALATTCQGGEDLNADGDLGTDPGETSPVDPCSSSGALPATCESPAEPTADAGGCGCSSGSSGNAFLFFLAALLLRPRQRWPRHGS